VKVGRGAAGRISARARQPIETRDSEISAGKPRPGTPVALGKLTVSKHGRSRGGDWHQQRVLRVRLEGEARSGSGQQRVPHFVARRAAHARSDYVSSRTRHAALTSKNKQTTP